MKDKIKNINQLAPLRKEWRGQKKTVVFTNGCFELLHAGHVRYLEAAKRNGDILIVGLNSDSSVTRLKGKGRPIMNQQDRAEILAALQAVDYVVIFDQDDPARLIQKLVPDVLIKGADWKKKDIIGADVVEANGGKVIRVPLYKGRSTSSILRKSKKISDTQKA